MSIKLLVLFILAIIMSNCHKSNVDEKTLEEVIKIRFTKSPLYNENDSLYNIDTKPDVYKLFTELNIKDSIVISCSTQGCGMIEPLVRKITIIKEESKVITKSNSLNKEIEINQFIPIIKDFNDNMDLMNSGPTCTTSLSVNIGIGNKVYHGTDTSCKWTGFAVLSKRLFNSSSWR